MRTRLLALVGVVGLIASLVLVLAGSAEYAGAAVPLDPTVKPDVVLSVANPSFVVKGGNPPKVGYGLTYEPHDCRGKVELGETPDSYAAPAVCDVYRIQINRDPNPLANNVIYFELDFDKTSLPSLDVVAAGLNPVPAEGDILMNVWDQEDHYLGENFSKNPNDEDPGGDDPYTPAPSIGGFNVKQSVYDITIAAFAGPAGPYTLRVKYSNEVFSAPHEILDESLTTPAAPQTPDTPVTPPDLSAPTDSTPTVALAPVTILPDKDLAGVGLGVDQQFNPQQAFTLHNTRTVAAVSKPPPGWLLWLALVLAPLAIGVAVLVVFQRRRAAFIS